MKALVNFLTSVKVAIVLLIILICASILGTLIPQGRSAQEYIVRYGQLGGLLQRLQITGLYHSVWYIALLALFSLNILVCTLVRLSPKFRRAFRPRVEADARSIQTLKVRDKLKIGLPLAAVKDKVEAELSRHHYRLKARSEDKKISLLGRKKVLGLFGSDVVHVGILIILAGGILSGLASRRQNLTLVENQTALVPGTDFSVRLDKFVTEYYPDGGIRDWKSLLTVTDANRPPYQKAIEVNHPLNHRGYVFYQSGYGWDWENPSLEVWVKKTNDPAYLQKIWLKVGQKTALEGENIQLTAARFIPDFVLDENNQPVARSLEPNNPAAFIEGRRGEETIFSGWVFAKFPDFTRMHSATAKESEFSFELKDAQAPQYSVIQMAKDPGVTLIWLGCALLMLGLFLAFYWPTRELKFVLEDSPGKTEVTAGGIATKNREAFQAEFEIIMNTLRKIK